MLDMSYMSSPAYNQAEIIFSKEALPKAIELLKNKRYDFNTSEAAKITKEDIVKSQHWNFQETFERFRMSQTLEVIENIHKYNLMDI